MSKAFKALKTVGKIYGIVWIVENCIIARGIALKKYYDSVDDYYVNNVESFDVRKAAGMGLDAYGDCAEEALEGWKRQIGTIIDTVKIILNKG